WTEYPVLIVELLVTFIKKFPSASINPAIYALRLNSFLGDVVTHFPNPSENKADSLHLLALFELNLLISTKYNIVFSLFLLTLSSELTTLAKLLFTFKLLFKAGIVAVNRGSKLPYFFSTFFCEESVYLEAKSLAQEEFNTLCK